ncbi:hypothetical protein Dsin_017160 [Dipteronia sinensis]|uniref:SPX domain-containing protein n=1 Tax=Dipteronia sinensis TaxID=43782 RepID=A0AAE0AEI1_9ROSI|nr:hypothetical protein Dsin_017160 [Dipteronia sinensis]
MKFGKEFRTHLEETLPEWRDKFLCYKPLKKLLKHFAPPPPSPEAPLQGWFVKILNDELEKFNDFYVDKEEDFVIRFQELKERIERVKEKSSGVFTSDSEFSEETMEIRKDFVTIHGEMVLLKSYSSLNFAGLVKILKKYDKRTGGLLCLPFTQLALHQPFFTTESLTRLVRECEANLELLFPLEAEVIESTPAARDESNPPLNNTTNIQPDTSSNVAEETSDVYRSTLAAMKAIHGLQKASSTYNPFSFSSRQDDDSGGAVTAENSDSNSSTASHNGEDDQDDTHCM